MRPFGCPVTIFNTIDHLGKFNGKADEGFFIGYSTNSKEFRVFNSRTRIVKENLHVQFSENTPNIAGSGRNWLFDIDALTKSMNYKPIIVGNQSNGNAGTKACDDAGKARMETDSPDAGFKPSGEEEKKDAEDIGKDSKIPSIEEPRINQENDASVNSTNNINTVSPTVNATSIEDNDVDENIVYGCADDPNIPKLEDIVYSDDDEDVGAEADMNNLDAFMPVSPILTTRIHKDHPVKQIIGDLNSPPQTRRMTNNLEEHGLFSSVHQRTNHKDFQNCLFACFLSQEEPKNVIHALKDPRNKKDERGIVIKNKARLVAQGYTKEEGINYDEMDVKSAFLYVEKALYGLHQAPRAWYETLSTYLLDNGFQRGKIDKTLFIRRDKSDILLVQLYVDDIIFGSTKKSLCTKFEKMMHKKFQMSYMGKLAFFLGLQVKQKEDGVFISQAKYVTEILKKFGFTNVKTTSTPMETQKPLLKDADGKDVDEHLYRSMIRSLMYLTSSRPDIMFAVCACARFQVNPKSSHLHDVKRIFRYLKGASLDRKSTTGAEYIAASSCCGQVLWIQNQLLDYGYNFMQTKIHIDNESTICIVKNPVFHSKTKHIEIRHHFIRDSYEKKLIQTIKIHTDQNVTDLLTKAFDVSRFQYLIASIGMLNL
ncbi:putative ribonuclease H-like domain-containing protein [Tanacetum coccineum]